ncbi:hypothetical protein FRC02_005650 [Tulasnella sp. 418]|nr:hypothetical protein FRC02_005650 [Tulasnella sp. 418]
MPQLSIDINAARWDEDKYSAIGTFLYNNYVQARQIVSEVGQRLLEPDAKKHKENNDYEKWLKEEKVYLESLEKEPPEETLAIALAEELTKLWAAEKEFVSRRGSNIAVGAMISRDSSKRVVHPTYKAASDAVTHHLSVIHDYESQLGIVGKRWTKDSKEYQLVVSCLFELQKAHLEGTGYKMSTQIAKHFKTRSKAIRKAINKYNVAARALSPP